MQPQTEIALYLQKITAGLVNISPEHANEIIRIAHRNGATATARLSKWEAQTAAGWRFIRTIPTTDEQLTENLNKAANTSSVMNMYMFDCYSSSGQCKGQIFTSNQNIF